MKTQANTVAVWKTETLPLRSGAGQMPTLITAAYHSVGSSAQRNQTTKWNKRHRNWKRNIETMFEDDMIRYLEIQKDPQENYQN